ncbi:lamin tail domain-containing protein [Rhodohalobacter halophilus]|uniref:lamin tail domain-containing protein n=1 Tax=Rhodohalobacter halophilus TaxID=1812810 RepID=UPI00083F5C05|nr:lamin tail domain-containing protein [Rhodohalobacter halophilus]
MREAIKQIKGVLQGFFLAGLLITSIHQFIIGQPSLNLIQSESFTHAISNDIAEQRDIVVNEILYRRESAGSPEFVELFNRSYKTINLQNWELVIGSGSVEVAEPIELKSNDYIVFTDHEGFAGLSDKIYYLPGFPVLTDNGSSVAVYNHEEILIDSLFYKSDWGEVAPGVSLERRDPGGLSIDPANWSVSLDMSGSTPGLQNSRYEVDFLPPEILFASLKGEEIVVYFDEFIMFDNSEGQGAVGSPKFKANGRELAVLEFNPNIANRVVLDTGSLSAGEEITLEIDGLSDFKGNMTSSSQPVAQPVQAGDLVLNEIMYHPLPGDDNFSGQSEYLEIFNRKNYAVSLEGIFLHDAPDDIGEYNRMDPVSAEMKWIPAREFALLYPENENLAPSESRTGRAFGISEELNRFGLRFERAGLGLVNSGRNVVLSDSTGNVIDQVGYSPDWHNPNLMTTQGVALERIDVNGESNDPGNWSSNRTVLGGTPLGTNSIEQVELQSDSEMEITLQPNPFSPDGDGLDDQLEIVYRFADPNYLLKVRIYDRYGRLVRKLADGYPAGLHGSLFWDGKMDDGSRSRIGIYIIYVQAYNASNGSRKEFKETAVLARQF